MQLLVVLAVLVALAITALTLYLLPTKSRPAGCPLRTQSAETVKLELPTGRKSSATAAVAAMAAPAAPVEEAASVEVDVPVEVAEAGAGAEGVEAAAEVAAVVAEDGKSGEAAMSNDNTEAGLHVSANETPSAVGKVTAGAAQGNIATRLVPSWVDSMAHMAAGWASGVVSMAMIYPIDTIKTRLQVSGVAFPPFVSTKQFVGAMYAGMPIGLAETGAVHGTSFLFYEFLKGLWLRAQLGRAPEPGEKPPLMPRFTACCVGCLAALMTMQVTLPLKVVLIRVQSGNAPGGIWQAVRDLYRLGGVRSFWTGAKAACYLVPNPAITFFLFERTQKFFMVRNTLRAAKAAVARGDLAGMQPEVQSGPNQDLVAGFAAKSIAAVATFPIQKGQAMMQGTGNYPNIFSALSENYRNGGVLGMYTGVFPKLMQAALQQSLIFRFKEQWTPFMLRFVRNFYLRKSRKSTLAA